MAFLMPNATILIAIDHLLFCGINPILGLIQDIKKPQVGQDVGVCVSAHRYYIRYELQRNT